MLFSLSTARFPVVPNPLFIPFTFWVVLKIVQSACCFVHDIVPLRVINFPEISALTVSPHIVFLSVHLLGLLLFAPSRKCGVRVHPNMQDPRQPESRTLGSAGREVRASQTGSRSWCECTCTFLLSVVTTFRSDHRETAAYVSIAAVPLRPTARPAAVPSPIREPGRVNRQRDAIYG
jgi:hypothetical protein